MTSPDLSSALPCAPPSPSQHDEPAGLRSRMAPGVLEERGFQLPSRFSALKVIAPGAAYALIMLVLLLRGLDEPIARSWAYDAARGWIGAHSWWAQTVIHSGGRALIWLVALSALATWALSFAFTRLRSWRRGTLFVFLGILLSTGIAGLLKDVTNVDCPWSLSDFGGTQPYITLFGDRPDALPQARCFPGAHSSSGFALLAFYFLLRDRSRRAARWALAGGFAMGALFAFGQEARGAHFLSHDLTSAVLVWYVLLALYAVMRPLETEFPSIPHGGIRTSRTGPAS